MILRRKQNISEYSVRFLIYFTNFCWFEKDYIFENFNISENNIVSVEACQDITRLCNSTMVFPLSLGFLLDKEVAHLWQRECLELWDFIDLDTWASTQYPLGWDS
jgi:hypothetical protein